MILRRGTESSSEAFRHSFLMILAHARGDYRPYSDVDIMLVTTLSDQEIPSGSWQESEIVGDMCIDHDVTISVTIRSQEQFKPQSLPYYRNIVTDGIRYNAGGASYA